MRETLGEFMLRARAHPHIRAAAPNTAANENVGSEGGLLVPPELAREVIGVVMQNAIVGRCRTITVGSNIMTLPLDTEAPWLASGTLWQSELQAGTPRKPLFTPSAFRLNRLTTLIPVSNELLDDAQALHTWAAVEVPKKISAKLTTAILRGDGASKPWGILQSPALITVARGGSVTATAAAMWKRMYGAGRGQAVWLHNPDVDIPTTPGQKLLLHGQETIAVEACGAAGQLGDLVLCDLSQYVLIARALAQAVSSHLFFDADASCFRWILRCMGQGLWDQAVQPENGAVTLSPFVTVAT